MPIELLTALLTFAFVSSITPGPNNLMLMTSGANFGFKPTIPHMLGISLGFALMIVLVGIGLMQLFDLYPISYEILKYASISYMLYLSYKIATSSQPIGQSQSRGKPFTFIQAALFQWVNPKAWAMALTAISVYAPNKDIPAVLLVALIFALVNLPSVTSWVVLGQQLKRFLNSANKLKAFNLSMAALLLLSLYPVLL